MSRLGIVISSVIALLGISTLPASAAEQTLKQQIQGSELRQALQKNDPTAAQQRLLSPTPARSMGSVLDTLTEGERALTTAQHFVLD